MFLAADEKGRILGRIQIIVNENEIRHFDTKMARFNKFDFVDDHRVSRALIRAAEKWLRDQKTEKIIGPFGYSNLDPAGLPIDGFDDTHNAGTIFNLPYAKDHHPENDSHPYMGATEHEYAVTE